ncbi:MAG: DUF4910 domain-containing protein [Proteobacteria bacterium]|nr:DUF4910 domain-containing protein [Pseudomonadota bacterium]
MPDRIEEIRAYLNRLFPVCRSITGPGNRETLKVLQEIVPLEIKEYPSSRPVYDWVVPPEWSIREAWIKNPDGQKIVDFDRSNLHVVSYSRPVSGKVSLAELENHLHYRTVLPRAIPYRTSYYREDWGFCLSYEDYQRFFRKEGEYEVLIDSTLEEGALTVGELLVRGDSPREYLISTYFCHPSLANDNLSGVVLTAFLARELSRRKNNFSYRIIFVPETIGAVAYCAHNEAAMKAIDCGFVITSVGGPGRFGYKRSFDPEHVINRIIEQAFQESGIEYLVYPFDIHGSDERQYSSPGFRINMASICKDKYYEYDFYHTSLDNLDFVKPEFIEQSLRLYLDVIGRLDDNLVFVNQQPHCEVMLFRHGLYPKSGGGMLPGRNTSEELDIILWLLFLCDGTASLWQVAEKTGFDFKDIVRVAGMLESRGLLKRIDERMTNQS